MRCYHLCNMYLAGLQAGLQSGHTLVEMASKYLNVHHTDEAVPEGFSWAARNGFKSWAEDHKTLVLLNGGYASALEDFHNFLQDNTHAYAWASFCEEEDALNGAMTNVGIVLPPKMYTNAREIIKIVDNYHSDRRNINIPGSASAEVFIHLSNTQPDGAIVSVVMYDKESHATSWRYTEFEFELMKRIARCDLMR